MIKYYKYWWINNSWRFWIFEWMADPDNGLDIWQEYRYMLDSSDKRGLTELIIEEYDKDLKTLCLFRL